jgi:serpin B
MTNAFPTEGNDVDALVESLSPEVWDRWVNGLGTMRAHFSMPKFTMEYELPLKNALQALGMGIAFDEMNADFTKIYDGLQRVYISQVKHKTFIEVDEKGTEAAAVTSVEIGVTSMPPMIAVNKPFIFAIRERFSGTILFMGVIYDPAEVR